MDYRTEIVKILKREKLMTKAYIVDWYIKNVSKGKPISYLGDGTFPGFILHICGTELSMAHIERMTKAAIKSNYTTALSNYHWYLKSKKYTVVNKIKA